MIHDPLCTFSQQDRVPASDCPSCYQIVLVRMDERAKSAHACDGNNCCMGTPE